MSKSTYNKIVAKLERLNEYLRYLSDIQKVNHKSFVEDCHFYGLAERYLQLTIEVLLDIGKLIILAEDLRKPEDNQDIFVVLGEAKILSKATVVKLQGVAAFRNILVHDYEKIDRGIVYEKLKKNVADFKLFKKQVASFLIKVQ